MAGSIPGPMGAVLTPSLIGVDKAGHLPNASTFCGRCESVCPVRIPLPKLMRHWREREFERHLSARRRCAAACRLWGFFATRPTLYRAATGARHAGAASRRAAARAASRSLPLAERLDATIATCRPRRARTFQAQWTNRRARSGSEAPR